MRIRRRDLLVGTAASVVVTGAGCSDSAEPVTTGGPEIGPLPVDTTTFAHGIASGDPLVDRVILWTRVTTTDPAPVKVLWVIASDPALTNVVNRGDAMASADADHTVKVDATGLTAGTTYYYAFALEGKGRTVVGRTRTLPSGEVARLRVAMTSCANYNNGWFNAYARIADRADLDVWIHLGDYIYEYADGVYGKAAAERPLDPKNECVKLEDYRRRYAHYKRDTDLQEIHRQHPLIAVWDDHEVANDAWKGGAENHQPDEGDYQARKLAGTRAFVEWLPIRVPVPTNDVPKIFRSFAFGNLMDLMMLDTRLIGRDKQIGTTDVVNGSDKGTPEQWADPSREMLGAEQETWLKGQLTASKARGAAWRFFGNQVIFSPTIDPRDKKVVSTDFWDGYQATRKRIVEHLQNEKIGNLVILTGDIHTSWALDVPADIATYKPDTGEGSVAVEMVGPAVTSQGLEGDPLASVAPALLQNANPHIKYNEVTRKGYLVVDITRERVQGEWYFVGDHLTKTNIEEFAAAFSCASGTSHLVEAGGPLPPREGAAPKVV